ncbi:MAG: hypothetical protein M1830_001780 [Pleopsidium flavum]|nr:MAG: hypothetical protein M1830_001780 [Pleopsidium flavum]
MANLTTVVKVLLPVLSVIAVLGTWVLSTNNGTLSLVKHINATGSNFLSGTHEPLKATFTGIRPIDDQLKILVTFFWPIVDGSAPTTSLQSVHFGGQIVAAWIVCMIESLRDGNRWRVISFIAIWGIIMQNVAFAVVIPLYLAIHLFTSPTVLSPHGQLSKSTTYLRVDPTELEVLPYSVFLGFIVPTILMCLPAPAAVTYPQKQGLIAFWQAFPLWISLWHMVISSSMKRISSMSGTSNRYPAADRQTVHEALRKVYLFGFAMSAVIHVAIISISLASILTPAMFATSYSALLRPSQVFIPVSLFSTVQVSSVGEGALYFGQWDELVGSAALLLWAAALYRNAHGAKVSWPGWASLVAKVIGLTVVAGPCSTALTLIWERDELIWCQKRDEDRKFR